MEKEVKTRKQVSYDQMTGLIEFLQEHPHLARGSTRGRRGRMLSLKLWNLCAKKLNTIEDGNPKDGKAWSRYWCDWKYRVRRRALELRAAKENNISPDTLVPLSDIEETLLNLIGENAVDGVVIKSDPLADGLENTEEDVPNGDQDDDDENQDYDDSASLNQSFENQSRVVKGRKRRHSSIEGTDTEDRDESSSSQEKIANKPRQPIHETKKDVDADNTDLEEEVAEFLRLEKEGLENSRRLERSIQTIARETTRLADAMTHIRDFLINNRITM